MKKFYLVIFVIFFSTNLLFSQNTTGVKSFDVPAKSTLKFNKFLINPTFSFVKEDIPTISIFNKTQWAGFENAPSSYLLNYSGKFQENNSFSASAYFQNYGLLTTTGGILNYSRNVMFEEESNLTFGLNIGVYKSGINSSKIITNTVDPLLNGFNNNTILVINPGINYGIDLLDFGISANNLVLYNLSNSKAVASDPEKSFQLHAMYTGFVVSNGYFDESKFTTLLRVENKKAKTEFTGNFMFEKPSLGWIQAGYNNVYGISGGLGFNINQNISVGYNFEKGLGNISNLGNSHEFVLAYVFNEWEERTDGTGPTYTKPVAVTPKVDPAIAAAEKARLENERLEKEKAIADAKFKAFAAAKAKAIEDAKNKEIEDAAKAKAYQEAKAKAEADAKIKAELAALTSAERAKANALAKLKADADAKAKAEADKAKAILDAKERAKQAIIDAKEAAAEKAAAEKAAKANFEAQRLANAKAIADAKAKADAEAKEAAKNKAENAKAQALLTAKQKADELERIRIETEKQKAEAARLNKIKADDDAKANAENLAKAKLIADNAKAEANRIAKEKGDAAKIAADKLAAENKAKADAAAIAKAETANAAKEKAEADKLAKAEADKLKADAAKLAKEKADADAKIKADADKIAADKLAAENKAKADAAAIAKADAANAAKEKAEADKLAKAEADKLKAEADKLKADAAKLAKDKADADAKIKADAAKIAADKLAADNKAKADAAATAKADADKLKADAAKLAKVEADKLKADAAKLAKDKADADAKIKADAAKIAADKLAAENKAKSEAAAIAKAEADKLKADAAKLAKDIAYADAKAKADAAKLAADKLAADNKAKADAAAAAKADAVKAAKDKADADAKAKADAAKSLFDKAAADAKAKADAEAERVRKEEEKRKADLNKSETDKSLDYISNLLDKNKKIKDQAQKRLDSIANSKLKDLSDLKEENDQSDKGIVRAPKAFVSASAQNKFLENLKNDLEQSSKTQNEFIAQQEAEYQKRLASNPNKSDPANQRYLAEIEKFKLDQAKSEQDKLKTLAKLDQLKTEIDIEKKRRIKRAAVETGQSKYDQDRAALKRIKETTVPSKTALTSADFDFGDPENNNQILKKIENTQTGFYLVLASHTDISKRDAFITKAIASGQLNIDFFFDVNTGKYYIFTKRYDSLDESATALEAKGNKPYNGKMFVVKIEN